MEEKIQFEKIIRANSKEELEEEFYENVPKGKFKDCYEVNIEYIEEVK